MDAGVSLPRLLYVITSSLTLAKCVRDQEEAAGVVSRVDQARVERILAEHDPFRVPSLDPEIARLEA